MKTLNIILLVFVLFFLFFVFVSFNSGSVHFLIQGIQDPELYGNVKRVYTGLGIVLFLQPIMALALSFYFTVKMRGIKVSVIYYYTMCNVFLCVLVFLVCATLPWSTPIAS